MKQIFKNSKKAFTLLEVMLAVAILVVASAMFLSGFLTSFDYSNNTGVFARLSSRDYSNAINKLSAKAADTSIQSKFKLGSGESRTGITVSSTNYTEAGTVFADFGAIVWKQAPAGTNGEGSLTYNTAIDGSNVKSLNRYSFCYVTKPCPKCDGQLRKYKAKDGNIYWFCWDPNKDDNLGCGHIEGPGV